MSPPRRPKGEKPAVTIRWQRRQMAQMEQTIADLRFTVTARDATVAAYDVRQDEAETELFDMARRLDDVSVDLANTKDAARRNAERLAYLEGYFYAKEKEAGVQQTAVFPASRIIPSHQPHPHSAASPGNQEGLQDGRQAAESAGFDPGAAGFSETAGGQVRREPADHSAHPGKRSVEHVEITDGLTKWAAW